jgi:hypothetical protein
MPLSRVRKGVAIHIRTAALYLNMFSMKFSGRATEF